VRQRRLRRCRPADAGRRDALTAVSSRLLEPAWL
jgi:hypothetical protein